MERENAQVEETRGGNTEAVVWGGSSRSSEEVPAMGMERRG